MECMCQEMLNATEIVLKQTFTHSRLFIPDLPQSYTTRTLEHEAMELIRDVVKKIQQSSVCVSVSVFEVEQQAVGIVERDVQQPRQPIRDVVYLTSFESPDPDLTPKAVPDNVRPRL